MPGRWTRFVLRHRSSVLAAWALVLVLGAVASTRLAPLLSNSFDVPGSDSERARQLLARDFGQRPDGTFTVVFPVRHPRDRALQTELRRRTAEAAKAIPGATLGQVHTGSGIVFLDVATPDDLQHAKAHTDALRDRLEGSPQADVTGQPAIQHDLDPVFASDLRRGEGIAVPLTLLVLATVFGLTLAVLVPFVTWLEADEPWIVERQMIEAVELPLNLRDAISAFRPTLAAVRAEAKRRARELPVVAG